MYTFFCLGQLPSLQFHISERHKMNSAMAHVNTAAPDSANNNSFWEAEGEK